MVWRKCFLIYFYCPQKWHAWDIKYFFEKIFHSFSEIKTRPLSFARDDIREPYTDGFLNGAAGKIGKETNGRFSNGNKKTIYRAHTNGALPRDVIKNPALAGGAGMTERWFLCKTCDRVYEPRQFPRHRSHNILKHPTQKPLELFKRLVEMTTDEGDVVVDPFMGAGTTAMAAMQLNRDWIGIENNKEYIDLANKRIKKHKGNSKLKDYC